MVCLNLAYRYEWDLLNEIFSKYLSVIMLITEWFLRLRGSGRGLVVRVLDSELKCREFDPHTGHGSLLKLRQFHLPQFASVYSAANEYQHCWEGTCDRLATRPGETVQLDSNCLR